eukprot:Tamp_08198.p1 GENE.Tamp_08198~~Tamp_08198.p1  ORF type:complete len:685 (+),score=118.99 Tamp_08198:104-2056(+)
MAVERAAAAIRATADGNSPPGGLREIRLTLLALPRDSSTVPEIRTADMFSMVQVLDGEGENADVMLTGLVLMRYLAQRQGNQKIMAGASGVSLVLKALKLHSCNPTLQGVACDTLGNLLQEEGNADQFLRLQGVDSVFSVVRDNLANTRVMEAACFLLGNVASSEEGLRRIAANNGGDVALSIIRAHKDDTDLLRELLFLVSNMAQSPQLKTSMANSGTVEAVAGVMHAHVESSELQAMGSSALSNIIVPAPGGDETRSNVPPDVLADAIAAIITSLQRHPSDPSVVRRAASAVSVLAGLRPMPPRLVGSLEVVCALTESGRMVLKTSQTDCQALVQILRCLEVLADASENRQLMLHHSSRVLPFAICVTQGPSARPLPVARTLSLVAKLTEMADISRQGAALPEGKGLELVNSALGQYWNHPSVVIPACTIIAALAKDTPAPQEGLNGAGEEERGGKDSSNQSLDSSKHHQDSGKQWQAAIGGLLKATRARPSDVAVAVSAFVALAWTCEHKVRPGPGEVGDLMGAFVMVMRAHPREADVAESACFMFSAVIKTSNENMRAQVAKSGAPLLVVMVLRHFCEAEGDVQPVLRRAVNAIRLVVAQDSSISGAVRLAGAPDALRTILSRYPDSQGLAKSARAALHSIEGDLL